MGLIVGLGLLTMGYVRETTTTTGVPVRWSGTNCIVVRPNAAGSADVSDGSDLAAVRRAAENWHRALQNCSYLRFELREPAKDVRAGFDLRGVNESALLWIEDPGGGPCQEDDDCGQGEYCAGCQLPKACQDARTSSEQGACCPEDQGVCCAKNTDCWTHAPEAIAITTLFFVDDAANPHNGRLLDGDIEFNGAHGFTFGTDGSAHLFDVESVVAHELGHLMGLAHPCDDGTMVPAPKNDRGEVVPPCHRAPQEMRERTMFYAEDPGKTDKSTPEQDDIRGICEVYPKQSDPGVCMPTDLTPDGCHAMPAPGGGGGLGPVAVLCLVVAASSRRRSKLSGSPTTPAPARSATAALDNIAAARSQR